MNKQTDSEISRTPLSVKVCLFLLLLIALLWASFSIYVALDGHPSYSHMGLFKWIMAGLTFFAALVVLVLWFLLRKRGKPAWYLAVMVLAATTLAGLFDDIGWIDVLVMLGSAIPLVLLIKDRKWYLNIPSGSRDQ